jgi:hypothetical protein
MNGNIWFGTNNGMVGMNLRENRFNAAPPKVFITNFQVYDNNFRIDQFNSLSYNQNDITFHFQTVAFKDPQRLKYVYQLEGYDDLPLTGNQESVHYTNLPPNKYSFIVYAINEDGVRSEKEAVLSFEINPPFWKTKWFIFLLLLVATTQGIR